MMSRASAASSERSTASLSVTNAHGDSPHRSSARATTDASSTAGCREQQVSMYSTNRCNGTLAKSTSKQRLRSFPISKHHSVTLG
uniref:Uncharacterized protein n=1 Tax=Zea mays TaxID=4577 RepID=A0A804LJ00_MAIZE